MVRLLLGGAVIAWISLGVHLGLGQLVEVDPETLARYVAPVVEESLKGAVLIVLLRRHRVGFMVDAAISGFAVGAGFATVENVHYFLVLSNPQLLLWILRGFSTAVMHGGVTAIMAVLSKHLAERWGSTRLGVFLPGLAAAIVLHSSFNHFFLSPDQTAAALLIILPTVFFLVFRSSERATRSWLGIGFDTDSELFEVIDSGRVSDTRIGAYLQSLKEHFPGEAVADMLCLIRLHLELSIQAKGILLARQSGFELEPDPEVEERFVELRYLEKSIGKTGLLALSPIFNMSSRDLWQFYMLGKK